MHGRVRSVSRRYKVRSEASSASQCVQLAYRSECRRRWALRCFECGFGCYGGTTTRAMGADWRGMDFSNVIIWRDECGPPSVGLGCSFGELTVIAGVKSIEASCTTVYARIGWVHGALDIKNCLVVNQRMRRRFRRSVLNYVAATPYTFIRYDTLRRRTMNAIRPSLIGCFYTVLPLLAQGCLSPKGGEIHTSPRLPIR